MKRITILSGLLVLSVYMGAIIIFALPNQYGSHTVYNNNLEAYNKPVVQVLKVVPIPTQIIVKPVILEGKAYYKQIAMEQADFYNLDAVMFLKILDCEAGFNPEAEHDGGHGKGITGFWEETFNRWNKQFFNGELDYENQEDQIKLMARVFKEGESYRDDWSSWNKYKKYGVCFNYQIRKLNKKV